VRAAPAALCRVLACLKDSDVYVQRNAAVLVREVVKHSEEVANIAVRAGAAASLVEYVAASAGSPRLAAVMALGTLLSASGGHTWSGWGRPDSNGRPVWHR
jgi:hypothetical protein